EDRMVNGSALIAFKECRTMINNVQYEAVERLGTAKLKLEIPQIEVIKKNRTTLELGIHDSKMKGIDTKLQINGIQTRTAIHTTATYTMLTMLLIVVLAVAGCSKRTTTFTAETQLATFTPTIAPTATFTPTI
ncbi:hypothetical protein KR200_002189, partial [Drosophila serrata]